VIKRRRILAIGVGALAFASASPAEAAGQTAKAAMPQVAATAKAWQEDATLVHLSSVSVRADGTAAEWKYSFYAPKSGKRCVITARSGNIALKEGLRVGHYTQPLGEFIDSDKAMQLARKNGLKGGEPSASVGRPAGAQAESTYWLVTGGWKTGDVSISLDAKTGKLSKLTVLGSDK